VHGSPPKLAERIEGTAACQAVVAAEAKAPRAGAPKPTGQRAGNQQTSPPAKMGRHAGGHRPIHLRVQLGLDAGPRVNALAVLRQTRVRPPLGFAEKNKRRAHQKTMFPWSSLKTTRRRQQSTSSRSSPGCRSCPTDDAHQSIFSWLPFVSTRRCTCDGTDQPRHKQASAAAPM